MRATQQQCHARPGKRPTELHTPGGLSKYTRRFTVAAALALLLFALPLLVSATGLFPGKVSSAALRSLYAQPLKSPTDTPTATPTNTPVTTPPSISLVSPSSGKGPVGAHVTVQGNHFSGGSATLFGSTQPDCSNHTGTLTSAPVSGGGISDTFIWPLSFSPGTYYICANGMANSSASYQVLTSAPPTLSLSASSIQMGQQLTIQGSNFAGPSAGASVVLNENTSQPSSSSGRTLPVNVALDGNGGFSVTWTVDGTFTGGVIITAYAEAEGSSPAVLQASAVVNIGAAPTATATANASPSAVVTTTPSTGTTTPPSNNGSSAGLIILLITGIILALLVVLGVVIFLMMRNRGSGNQGQPGYGDYGGYGGYGGTGTAQVPQFGQGLNGGMFPTTEQFGQVATGRFGATQQYGGAPVGAVSQWDDMDSQPGPDWQPRPMTGYHPDYDSADASQYGGYDDQYQGQGAYPPVDPWDDASANPANYGAYPQTTDQWYGGAPQGQRQGQGQPFSGNQPYGGPPAPYGPEELYGGQPQQYGAGGTGRNPRMSGTAGGPGNPGNPSRMGGTGATRSVDPRYSGNPMRGPGNLAPDDATGSTAPDWNQGRTPNPAADQWPDLSGNGGSGGNGGNTQGW